MLVLVLVMTVLVAVVGREVLGHLPPRLPVACTLSTMYFMYCHVMHVMYFNDKQYQVKWIM